MPLQPPEVAARNYLLIDLNADQVLAEREADKPTEPASLTKIMTLYILFGYLKAGKMTLDTELAVRGVHDSLREHGLVPDEVWVAERLP